MRRDEAQRTQGAGSCTRVTPRLGRHRQAFLVPRNQSGSWKCSAVALAPVCRLLGTLRQLKAGRPGGGSAHRGSLASQRGPEASLGASPQDGWGPPGLAAARAHGDQRARAGRSRPQKSPATPHRASPSSLEPTAKGVSQASGSERYQGAWEWTFKLSNRPLCLGPQKEDGVKRPGGVPGPSPASRSHSRG